MAKAEVIVPINESVLERRRSSLVDHIKRIREANTKRQIVPLWELGKERRTSQNFKGPGMKPSLSKQPDVSNENLMIQAKRGSKSIPTNNRQMNLQKTTKKNARKGVVDKKKIPKVINHEQNEEEIDENYIHKNASNIEKSTNKKMDRASEDIIVLEWLHNLDCPTKYKQTAFENTEGSKKAPIPILRTPSDSSFTGNIETAGRKTSSSVGKKPTATNRSLEKGNVQKNLSNEIAKRKSVIRSTKSAERNVQKNLSNEIAKRKSVISSSKSVEKANDAINIGSNNEIDEYESKEQINALSENNREIPDVEFYVSELEKLQIIMNLDSLSPKDAAIIIWLDDLPDSLWKPDYHRRLSVTSNTSMNPLQRSETALKSDSVENVWRTYGILHNLDL